MPKIICTVTNDLTYDQRMIRICTSLTNCGYEVLLVGRERSKSIPLSEKIFEQKRMKCWFDKGKLFYLEYNFRLLIFLWFARFDVICSIDLDTILPGFYIAKWRKKVCVYDAHEYFSELPEVVNRPTVKKVWKWVEQKTIPKLKYCYTVGEEIAKVFEKTYGTPFKVIRNVPFQANAKVISADQKGNVKIILYQGALNDGRGIESAIAAMQEIENVELWLAGEGDLSEELRYLTQALKVEEKVKFLGYIQPIELKELTLKADIGLNLLENKGLNYYYSLANKAFDYIQADLPAIHMNFPEYQKINQDYEVACLIDDLAIETVVAAIQKMINDPVYYERLKANCRVAKEVFVWEKEVEKLELLYQRIFEENQ